MITDNIHIDDLIAKYLEGDITIREQIELDDWVSASPENRKYFDDIQHIFFKSPSYYKYKKVDTQKAWQQMQEKMLEKKVNKNTSSKSVFISRRIWISIAASVAVLTGVTFLLVRNHALRQNSVPVIFVSGNIPVEEKLPDKSQITLNKNSRIQYTFNKEKKLKELHLTGEAFIEVKHTRSAPLVVIAGNTYIKDIGTSFNVKAYDNSGNIEVFVKNGEVKFFTSGNNGISLKEGELGVYNNDSDSFSKKEESPNVISYKTRDFVFKGTKLSEVVALLNEVYQTNIEFQNQELANCTITVSFSNESIEMILGIITETLELSYTKTVNGYLLSGAQCQSR